MNKNRTAVLSRKFKAPLATPTDLPPRATQDLAAALNALLADVFALFLKTKNLRAAHGLGEEHDDIATASLIENWVDETERRVWFLFETTRTGDPRH